MMPWNQAIIGSGHGFLPIPCQAITQSNINFLRIKHLGTNSNEIQIKPNNFH